MSSEASYPTANGKRFTLDVDTTSRSAVAAAARLVRV
jgi:hypothetical protein